MISANELRFKIDATHNPVESDLRSYQQILKKINKKHKEIHSFSDPQLKDCAQDLSNKAQTGIELDALLIDAYALVKEVCIRQLGLCPFDVQIIAAIALHKGKLIEMQTGEGKTLSAVFPAYLNALTQKGVHILTFNDYLAKRDANWMGPVYQFLGLSVDFIEENLNKTQRKKAYLADITYATAKEIGFDYLRSFMAFDAAQIVLRPFNYALIDEADALLIDEARNPLVLAGNTISGAIDFHKIAQFVANLKEKTSYTVDPESRTVYLTKTGWEEAEQAFQVEDLLSEQGHDFHTAINLSLQAHTLLNKDIDYVVKNGAIKLIDEFTGRIVEDRKWRNGLQTAVEAKEGLKIQSEGAVLNSITLQHLLQKYPAFSGMTATAQQSSEELYSFYQLKIVVIPPNKACIRVDHPDLIFTTKAAKEIALTKEIKEVHQTGQPILIGTLTVKESEELVEKLRGEGVKCQVLNARNDEMEAEIIAQAGTLGAVTISTNMAGRGTDIKLGGEAGIDKDKVIHLGGLYVIGTNRHESSRIDQQLKGRAGRQGDVGSSRFFISFEDELMIKYKLKEILPKKFQKLTGAAPVKHKKILHFIDLTQKIIEGRFFDMRKNLYEYSSFIELQRGLFQGERQKILLEEDAFFKLDSRIEDHLQQDSFFQKLKTVILFQYDNCWADHLDYLSQVREGIHLVRLGGQQPLREFRKRADEAFYELQDVIKIAVQEKINTLFESPNLNLTELGVNPPTSTWTYIINDNPFGDQLSIMLLDNSNIGLTADPISALFLFIFSLFKRKVR